MKLEIDLISTLLSDASMDYPEKYSILASIRFPFDTKNKVVLDFIVDHYQTYRKIPDNQTVKERFPVIDLDQSPEPFKYYIEEAKKYVLSKGLREKLDSVESVLDSGDSRQAYSEFIVQAREPIFDEIENNDLHLKKAIDASIEEYRKRRDTEDAWGLKTGFDFIDNATLGLSEGDFWVLAARPKNFKTWVLCKMFQHISFGRQGKFLLFSKEMPKHEIEGRLLSIIGNFDYSKFIRYDIPDEDLFRTKDNMLLSLGESIIIGQEPGQAFDLGYIKSKIFQYEPNLVVIDGLYLFSKTTDWKDITDITRNTRGIALDTGIPILATWQLNRGSGKKKMRLEDLAYADALSQNATAVIMQTRVYDEVAEVATNTLDVEIVGSRRGPSEVKGNISIGFKSMRFVEDDKDPDEVFFSIDSLNNATGIDL